MTCLNSDAKSTIINYLEVMDLSDDEQKELKKFVNAFDICTTEDVPKGRKSMRPLSKYNIYMSSCLKETDMRTCVQKYHKIKHAL